jgi:hypothetical protein
MPCHLQDRTLAQAGPPRAMQATMIAAGLTGLRLCTVIVTMSGAQTGRFKPDRLS